MADTGSPLDRTLPAIRASLERALDHGVPAGALAVAARWWQLETWLRQLVYLELRAAHGLEWTAHLSSRATRRAERDELNSYMRTPDASLVLAYLDVGELFSLIDRDDYWHLFEPSLLPRVRWRGAVDELTAVRHRFAHSRRPHPDDPARIERVLRDLESGAWNAIRAYHATQVADDEKRDPVVKAWLRNRHRDSHLIEHAARQYDVGFWLEYTRRPWASGGGSSLSGTAGVLWRVHLVARSGAFDIRQFWTSPYLDQQRLAHLSVAAPTGGGPTARELLVHALQPYPSFLVVTFAAVDNAAGVADAIGACFQAALTSMSQRYEPEWYDWVDSSADLDPRLQIGTALALGEDTSQPVFSIFGAG